MAGGMWDAQNVCNAYCDEVGFCVSLTRTDFSYTGGSEPGFIVGLINYPRFPAAPDVLWAHAEALAARLRLALKQDSYSIQAPDRTVWISHRDESPAACATTCSPNAASARAGA